ncbi:hypothetical protein D3C72_2227580 [compost metagenome]
MSGLLGNTPKVCRAAYVHPRVLDLFENGGLAEALPGAEAKGFEPRLIRLLSPQ